MDQQNVAVCLLDLFANVEQVLAALFNDLVHLSVVVDDNGVVHLHDALGSLIDYHGIHTYVWLRRTELELDNANLRLLHTCRTARGYNDVLVKYHAIYEFGVFNRSSDLLDNANVAQVNV